MGIDLDSFRVRIGCFNGVLVYIQARRNPTFTAANRRTLHLNGFLGKAVSFLVIAVLLMRGGVELNPGPCARTLQTGRRREVEEIKVNKDHTFAKSFGFFMDCINANAAYLQTSTFSSTAGLHEEHLTKSSQSKVFSKAKLLRKPTFQFQPKDTTCTVNSRIFKNQQNIYVDESFSQKDFGLYYYSKTHQIKKRVFPARPGKLCNVSIVGENESLADYHSDNVHPVNKNNTTVTGHPTNALHTFINDVTIYDLLLLLPFYLNEKEIPVDTTDVKPKGLDIPSCKPKIVKSTKLETALGVDGPRGDLFPIGRGDGWIYMVLSCFEDVVVLTYTFIRAILCTTFALALTTAGLAVSVAIHAANVATYVAIQGRHFCKAFLMRSSVWCWKGCMTFTLTLTTRLHKFFIMAKRHTDLFLEATHTAERTSDNLLTLDDIHLCRKQTIPESKCLQRDVLGAFKSTDGNTLRAVRGRQESLCNDHISQDVDLNERVTGQLKVLTAPRQFCFQCVTVVYRMAYTRWLLHGQTLCLCRSTRASARANVSGGKDRVLSTVYTLTDKYYRKYTMCILEKYLWQQSFCATIIQNSNGNAKIKFPDLDLDGNVDGNVNANLNTSPKGKFISLRNDVNSSTMLDFDSHVFLLKSSFLFLSCIRGCCFDNITTMLNVQHSRNRTGNEILLLTCVKFDFSSCTRVTVHSPAFLTLEVPDVLSSGKAGSEKVYLSSVNRMEIVGFIWIVNAFSRLQIEMFIKLAYSSIHFSRVKIIIYSGQVQIMIHIQIMYFRISDIQMQDDSYVWLEQVTISNSHFQTETFINLMRSAISFSLVKFEIYLTTLYKREQVITYIGLVQFKIFDIHVQSRTHIGLVQFKTFGIRVQSRTHIGLVQFNTVDIHVQSRTHIGLVQFKTVDIHVQSRTHIGLVQFKTVDIHVQSRTHIGLVQFKIFDIHVQSRTHAGLVQLLTQLTQAQVVAPFGKMHVLISIIPLQTKLLIKQVHFVVCNFPKRHDRFLASQRVRHRWRCIPPRRPEVLKNPVRRYVHSTRFRFKAKYLLKLCHHRFILIRVLRFKAKYLLKLCHHRFILIRVLRFKAKYLLKLCHHRFILIRVLRFWRFRFPLKVNASHFKSRQIRIIDEEQKVTIESDPTPDNYKSRPSHYLLLHIKFGQTWSSEFQWNVKNVRGQSASYGLNDADNPDQSYCGNCGSGNIPPTNSQSASGDSGNTSDSRATNGFGGDKSGRRDDGDESEDESQDEEEGEQSQSDRTRRQKKKDKRFLDLLKRLLLWSRTRHPRALTYYPHSEVHMTTPKRFHQLFSGAVTDSGYDVRIVVDDEHEDDEALEENVQNEHHEIQCGGDLEVQQLLQQLVHWLPTVLPLALTWSSTSRDPPSSRRQLVCGSNPNSVVQQHETLQSNQQLQVLPRNPFLLRDFITLLSIPEEDVPHDFLSEDDVVSLRLTRPIQDTQYVYNAGDTDITRNCGNRGAHDAGSRRCSGGLTPAASLTNCLSLTQDDNWQTCMNGLRRCSRCNNLDNHERLSPCNHLLCPDCSRNFRTRNEAANVPCPVCGEVVHSTERLP